MLQRWLAAQFARPSGLAGRLLIAPWLNRISRAMNRLVLEALDPRPDEDLLEIGFGGGALLEAMLARSSGSVTGVDISGTAVARARRRLGKARRLRLFQGSVERIPLAEATVDAACSVNNIYFWTDPAAGFAELARVIRPGGRLVIAFEPPEELAKWPGHRFGFRIFEEAEVVALATAAGFDLAGSRAGRGRKPDFFVALIFARKVSRASCSA